MSWANRGANRVGQPKGRPIDEKDAPTLDDVFGGGKAKPVAKPAQPQQHTDPSTSPSQQEVAKKVAAASANPWNRRQNEKSGQQPSAAPGPSLPPTTEPSQPAPQPKRASKPPQVVQAKKAPMPVDGPVVSASASAANDDALCEMSPLPLVDIGINLGDDQFHGKYRGKALHDDDFAAVMARARKYGVVGMVITAGSLSEAKECVNLARKLNKDFALPETKKNGFFCTVGCHPTRANEFLKKAKTPEAYLEGLRSVIRDNRDVVVAVGECGLDYDRLFFCEKDVQQQFFPLHFQLASEFELPMFLHDRNTGSDFLKLIKDNRALMKGGGVVHSFTGTVEQLEEIIKLDLYVSVNGCSMKTEENLEAVKRIPLDRLLLETDAPWCDIRPTHASWPYLPEQQQSGAAAAKKGRKGATPSSSAPEPQPKEWETLLPPWPQMKKPENFVAGCLVKGRNEPCTMARVLQVVYGLRKSEVESPAALAKIVFDNSCRLFKLAL